MEWTDDTNRIIKDSNWKDIYNNLKKQTEQQAARLPEKVDMKLEGLMKVLTEITYQHKYLKEGGSTRQ